MARTPEDERYIARTVARARRLLRDQPDLFLAIGELRPEPGRRRHIKVLDHFEWVQVDAERYMVEAFAYRRELIHWERNPLTDEDFEALFASIRGDVHRGDADA